jgi:hypothetical protein
MASAETANPAAAVPSSGNEGREAYSTVMVTHAVIQNCHQTRRTVHLAMCGHERFVATITNHQMQVEDANRPRVLPCHGVVGNVNLHALMRAAFVSQIGFWFVILRSKIEDRPNLLAFHVERPCATQPSAIGSSIRAGG